MTEQTEKANDQRIRTKTVLVFLSMIMIRNKYRKKLSSCAEFLFTYGGAKEDRTPDPLLAKQVLSQLSYNPMYINSMKWWA